jgi:hypothetical protein
MACDFSRPYPPALTALLRTIGGAMPSEAIEPRPDDENDLQNA